MSGPLPLFAGLWEAILGFLGGLLRPAPVPVPVPARPRPDRRR